MKDDSGTAYPFEFWSTGHNGEPQPICGETGLTKREWFAGMAMQAFIIRMADETLADHCAKNAFAIADSMLKEGKDD